MGESQKVNGYTIFWSARAKRWIAMIDSCDIAGQFKEFKSIDDAKKYCEVDCEKD